MEKVGQNKRDMCNSSKKLNNVWDFPGGPVVKTPCSQCRGCGVGSLVGELRSHMPLSVAPPKKEKKKVE